MRQLVAPIIMCMSGLTLFIIIIFATFIIIFLCITSNQTEQSRFVHGYRLTYIAYFTLILAWP